MSYLRIYESKSGGHVDLHPLHGEDELPNNLEAACIMADLGYAIELLPALHYTATEERKKWLFDVTSSKNPDVRINKSIIGDIKTPNPNTLIRQSTINRCIYSCAQQKVSIAIVNLFGKKYSITDIKKGIFGALQPNRNKSIKEVWIITTHGKLFKAARDKLFDEKMYDELDIL